eukprot:861964-Lingulodinium_polyedra.AAC.1
MPGVTFPPFRLSTRIGRLPQLSLRARPSCHRRERRSLTGRKGLPGPRSRHHRLCVARPPPLAG